MRKLEMLDMVMGVIMVLFMVFFLAFVVAPAIEDSLEPPSYRVCFYGVNKEENLTDDLSAWHILDRNGSLVHDKFKNALGSPGCMKTQATGNFTVEGWCGGKDNTVVLGESPGGRENFTLPQDRGSIVEIECVDDG